MRRISSKDSSALPRDEAESSEATEGKRKLRIKNPMKVRQKGIRRLSLAVGGLSVLIGAWRFDGLWRDRVSLFDFNHGPWFLVLPVLDGYGYDGSYYYVTNLIILTITCILSFVAGWAAIRIAAWVLAGFFDN